MVLFSFSIHARRPSNFRLVQGRLGLWKPESCHKMLLYAMCRLKGIFFGAMLVSEFLVWCLLRCSLLLKVRFTTNTKCPFLLEFLLTLLLSVLFHESELSSSEVGEFFKR